VCGKDFHRQDLLQRGKKGSFELWKAKVLLKEIWSQLQMSEAILRRILTVAKNNPDDPCPERNAGIG
jgi:hypothetical protein